VKVTFFTEEKYQEWATRYLQRRADRIEVTQLPPQPERIQFGVEIGDFFVYSATRIKQAKLPVILGLIVIGVIIVDFGLYLKKRRKQKRIAKQILYDWKEFRK
jgi:hypothetical protein